MLSVLRLMRVVRLIKLFRLFRLSRIVKRWESSLAVDYAMLSLFKSLSAAVLLAHWMACTWALQAHLQEDITETWLLSAGLCGNPADDAAFTTDFGAYACFPASSVFASALYWATMTITSSAKAGFQRAPLAPGPLPVRILSSQLVMVT